MVSFKKKELNIIANGIESWAPIVIGANILETSNDIYKKKGSTFDFMRTKSAISKYIIDIIMYM